MAQSARVCEARKKMQQYCFDPRMNRHLMSNLPNPPPLKGPHMVSSLQKDKDADIYTRNLLKPMPSAAIRVHAFIWKNRACHFQEEDTIKRAYPYLQALGLHPEFQGQGIGRILVHSGLRRAEEQWICVSDLSARGRDGSIYNVDSTFSKDQQAWVIGFRRLI
ncbi:hypothetical protein VMCG_08994 [Cytospora schulzeri]|uniref:N-acetyltransferase domain-containing protein n=1 Tax=Cytospora schulzeri TaxID=448051 RepID=A0A423VPN4_9PEZI|nr:hypothetical protein VMCG_08994 [Valsa malicola]